MLKLSHISVNYEEEKVLEDISMVFKPGEVNVITGPSGSGKSTLIKLINGIIPQMTKANISGQMTYARENLLKLDITARSHFISTVFQNPKTQFYCVNSTDEMAFALENRGMKQEEILRRIDHYSRLLHTQDLLNHNIFELSGGQKQMTAITSVACLDQAVYIFDEPSSSLDTASIELLKQAILTLKKMGKIIIIAEHRLYYLQDVIDHLWVIENKKINCIDQKNINEEISRKYQLRSLTAIKKADLMNNPENFQTHNIYQKDLSSGVIECKDYHYKYPKEADVFDMSLSFNHEITFIIGENGVGKTTFVRCLCGLNKKFKGSTYINQKKIRKASDQISLVMQDVNYQLFTDSVWDEISLVSDQAEEKKEILQEFGLLGKRENHPQSLSGGEKQRLAIAVCLASKKPIVIFDEPTSGLCKKSMEQTIQFIHQMASEGRKVIIVTHDYEFIQACGGQVIEFVK